MIWRAGQHVSLGCDVDLFPYATLAKGERGHIVEADEFSVIVKLNKVHKGLHLWDNEAHLIDPELGALVHVMKPFPVSYAYASIAAALALALISNATMGTGRSQPLHEVITHATDGHIYVVTTRTDNGLVIINSEKREITPDQEAKEIKRIIGD